MSSPICNRVAVATNVVAVPTNVVAVPTNVDHACLNPPDMKHLSTDISMEGYNPRDLHSLAGILLILSLLSI